MNPEQHVNELSTTLKEHQALAKEFIAAFDKAIADGPWDKGLFLSGVGNRLTKLRNKIHDDFAVTFGTSKAAAKVSALEHANQQAIYISLYVAGGNDMTKWEQLLNGLSDRSISRPIYQNEEDVRASIRAKPDKINDAYVKVMIDQQNIISPTEEAPRDKHGHTLLILKPGAIDVKHIVEFMHQNGSYNFVDGKLHRIGDQKFLDFL